MIIITSDVGAALSETCKIIRYYSVLIRVLNFNI